MRMAAYQARHAERVLALYAAEQAPPDVITPEFLTASIRARMDADSVALVEGISNYKTIIDHLQSTRPASMFTSGGGSLGWNGGAAIGARLAHPDKTVFALGGDGSYMFSVPS